MYNLFQKDDMACKSYRREFLILSELLKSMALKMKLNRDLRLSFT